MKCPYCDHHDDRVLDTRIQKEGEFIKRRRECLKCKGRFSTQESVLDVFPMVVKKDGRREHFHKDKILKGIRTACQKRPVSTEAMNSLVDQVSKWVADTYDNEAPSKAIGEKVMKELFELDDVAYIRFASVYRQFRDIKEFMNELGRAHSRDTDNNLQAPPTN